VRYLLDHWIYRKWIKHTWRWFGSRKASPDHSASLFRNWNCWTRCKLLHCHRIDS